MPKKPATVAADIHARMQREGKKVMTMTWPDFYKEADIKRFTDSNSDNIWEAFVALGIVFGQGKNVVTFCDDTHFAS